MREILREWELGFTRPIVFGVEATPNSEKSKIFLVLWNHKDAQAATLRKCNTKRRKSLDILFIKSKFELQNFLPSANVERFLYYLVLSSRYGKLVSEISLHLVTDLS